jgi:antitoxin (DNA-binding transcriptional repressor) of toxin-antitoxin stability system
MYTVGIRELKAKLSEHLRRVRKGEVVLVTDRGRVIAELRASRGHPDLPPEMRGLQDLIEQGVVREGAPTDLAVYRRSPLRSRPGTTQSLLDEEREDR